MPALSETARERGIKYFLISYVDLFGTLRAKLVPAAAIDGMAKSGAGFAGFASWLDMTPAEEDAFFVPFAERYGLSGLSRDWDSYRTRNDEDIMGEILEAHGHPLTERPAVAGGVTSCQSEVVF